MGYPLSSSLDGAAEIAAANFPLIREMRPITAPKLAPVFSGGGEWKAAIPQNVGAFAAVAYFFAREIHQKTGVPVGIIHTSQSGMPAQVFASEEKLAARGYVHYIEEIARMREEVKKTGTLRRTYTASGHFNTAVAPIIPYAIKGVIWWQGESRTTFASAVEYQNLFPDVIRDWRERWGYDFPFYYCQLASVKAQQTEPNDDSGWVRIRAAQASALSLPNTAMCVLTDDINTEKIDDVHTNDKQKAGHRLALIARKNLYGEPELVASGPTFKSLEIKDGMAVITFDNIGGGLVFKGLPEGTTVAKGEEVGFATSDLDHWWTWAEECVIDGATVTLRPAMLEHEQMRFYPAMIRYGWALNPIANLYNAEGLPACPFLLGEEAFTQ